MGDALDFDYDSASGFDRIPFTCAGTFDLRIASAEQFPTGVDENGKVIPGKKAGVGISVKFDVVKVVSQTPSTPDMLGYDKEKASDWPIPGPSQEGDRRAWFCNPEYEQNRQRLRHLVQVAAGYDPDSEEALAAVADQKDKNGKPVGWTNEIREALGEDNPLEGIVIRAVVNRVVTQKGKGNVMYVPTFERVPE